MHSGKWKKIKENKFFKIYLSIMGNEQKIKSAEPFLGYCPNDIVRIVLQRMIVLQRLLRYVQYKHCIAAGLVGSVL